MKQIGEPTLVATLKVNAGLSLVGVVVAIVSSPMYLAISWLESAVCGGGKKLQRNRQAQRL